MERVKAAIQAETPLPPNKSDCLHNAAALDLAAVAKKWALTIRYHGVVTNETYRTEELDFRPATNQNHRVCLLLIIEGKRGSEDALEPMFDYMGTSSSKLIYHGRWKLVAGGLGDYWIGEGQSNLNEVKDKIIFIRDNIAVELRGRFDQMPELAHDIDEAIQNSPVIRTQTNETNAAPVPPPTRK